MKKNKETKKLKEGEELIFSDSKTLMEKVTVESLDKKAGYAILSNKVKVSRTIGPNGTFQRLDGKPSEISPITEESEKKFNAFKAYHSINNNVSELVTKVRNIKDTMDPELILELDKKISKIINKYFEQ